MKTLIQPHQAKRENIALTKVSLGGQWQMFLRKEPDLLIDSKPFVALTMMYHPVTHEFVSRALGRLVESGQVDSDKEFLTKSFQFFQSGTPCLGMKPQDVNFPLSCQFSPNCSIIIPKSSRSNSCSNCRQSLNNPAQIWQDPKKLAMDIFFNQGGKTIEILEPSELTKLWNCAMCSKQVPFQNIQDHLQKVHLWIKFECRHCEERFVNTEDLWNHTLKEHPKIKQLFCSICQMRMPIEKNIESLEKHLRNCMKQKHLANQSTWAYRKLSSTDHRDVNVPDCPGTPSQGYKSDSSREPQTAEPCETIPLTDESDVDDPSPMLEEPEPDNSNDNDKNVQLTSNAACKVAIASTHDILKITLDPLKDSDSDQFKKKYIPVDEAASKSTETVCIYCRSIVPLTLLPRHNMFRHQIGDYHCPQCSQVCQKAQEIIDHVKIHPDVTNIKCPNCQQDVNLESNGEDLMNHMATCQKIKFLWDKPNNQLIQFIGKVCMDCLDRFETEKELQEHESGKLCSVKKPPPLQTFSKFQYNHKRVSEFCYICLTCNKEFKTGSGIRAHERREHYGQILVCDHCGLQFTNEISFQKHQNRKHPKSDKLKCKECGFFAGNGAQLLAHKEIHEERKHLCMKCGKKFVKGGHLAIHLRSHTGEKPFKCDSCYFSTATSGNLANHKKHVHQKEARKKYYKKRKKTN